jgi:hypothetical protein
MQYVRAVTCAVCLRSGVTCPLRISPHKSVQWQGDGGREYGDRYEAGATHMAKNKLVPLLNEGVWGHYVEVSGQLHAPAA